MSSIIKSVKKAFSLISPKYPLVYWAIDLHGVCFQSNYENYEKDNIKNIPSLVSIKQYLGF